MMIVLGTINNYFKHIKHSTSLKRNNFNKILILLIEKTPTLLERQIGNKTQKINRIKNTSSVRATEW